MAALIVAGLCVIGHNIAAAENAYLGPSPGRDVPFETTDGDDTNRFLDLALLAESAAAAEQKRFIQVALDEILLFYEVELDTVQETPLDGSDTAERAVRWEASTNRYVDGLTEARNRLDKASDVNVLVQDNGAVLMFVDDSLVMVSSPRLEHQNELESRIATRLCPTGRCMTLIDPAELSVDPLARRGLWRTNTYRMPDGGTCVFQSTSAKILKQRLCTRLVQELRHLSDQLKRLDERNRRVDWMNLRIEAKRGSSLHDVRFSDAARITLWLPLLAADSEGLTNWPAVARDIADGKSQPAMLEVTDSYVRKFELGDRPAADGRPDMHEKNGRANRNKK